jgi:glutathione synthase/RimK-type ligase-like ATP-grasp enzyme
MFHGGTAMTSERPKRLGLLWRGDRAMRQSITAANNRLVRIFEALAAVGIAAEPVVFAEEFADEVRDQMLKLDGVLVWVDPLSDGKTRTVLDPLLREVAARGVLVSAHPDVILKMGTKEVLYRTKSLGWGTDTFIYRSPEQLRDELPRRLDASGPRVLKRHRGNGGQGVWKVERLEASSVRVLHALRGSVPEVLPIAEFLRRCDAYFADGGCIVDQPFQARLPEGMIRCYMIGDKVAGYGHQLIKALVPPPPEGPDSPQAQPGPRIMHGPAAPQFQALRLKMETEWTPQMMRLLDNSATALPIIWDADFLYGPRDTEGNDTYVLCEINISAVFPIPDEAPAEIARLAKLCLAALQ